MTTPVPPDHAQGASEGKSAPAQPDSDQQWMDRLAARMAPAHDAEALREADLLRHAILREDELTKARLEKEVGDDQSGSERLLFALRREGLLSPGDATGNTAANTAGNAAGRPLKRPVWMMPTALAASVMVGFLAIQALQYGQVSVQYDEPPTMRGQIQEISVQDPAPQAKAQAIQARLKGAGLSARIYQNREQFIVDSDLISETMDQAKPVLDELGLQARAGLARIVISKKQKP